MTLLYISILWFAACVDSISAGERVTVSAKVGSTVILPCKLKNTFTETPHIWWRTENNETVFERSIEGTAEGSGYEGRVDVPEDELLKGNCSLVLKNVRITDDGVDTSFVVEYSNTKAIKLQEISRVNILVDVLHNISAAVGSTTVLPCEWRNLSFQTPHIIWYMDSEVVFERKGKESFPGEGYEGRLDVPEDELHNGNCSLVLRNVTLTDEAIYRGSMAVKHPTRHILKLVQKVKLSVSVQSENSKDEKLVESKTTSGEAGINCPRLLILIISLLMCFLFSH
ncbi:uncharacterized protein LOC132875071 [Neoarius graeffei]|uniref:uncharacterized protein LOC132875071 n=1 Tax=Neoarius graeffei TaxID=443677 RepID=UPI00298D3BEC|nr:uncharacterized protein LOC132875071 [Neoarius graeffei]